jgi:hypothetical protein
VTKGRLAPALTRPSMLSSRQLRPPRVGDEVTVDYVRKVPLQAAHGLFVGLARFPLPSHVGLSVRHDPALHQGDVVQGPVQLTVPPAVQPVSLDLPRGGRERSRPGQHGEGGLRPNSGGVAHLPEDLGGDERTDARIEVRLVPVFRTVCSMRRSMAAISLSRRESSPRGTVALAEGRA